MSARPRALGGRRGRPIQRQDKQACPTPLDRLLRYALRAGLVTKRVTWLSAVRAGVQACPALPDPQGLALHWSGDRSHAP